MHSGIVVFDVDGVIYKDFFLKRIAQSKGLTNFIKVLSLGIRYYRNKISVNELLRRGYSTVQDLGTQEAQEIAREIKKVTNIKETVRILQEHGYFIALVSVGIPDYILENLADEIGADYSRGMPIEIRDGLLDASSIKLISKVDIVEQLLRRLKLTWDHVISIGDDPNNIELFKKSKFSVGFNPSRSVRKHSDVVIEGSDLLEIIPHIVKDEKLPKKLRKDRFYWRRESIRKGIHFLGSAIPFFARFHKPLTLFILAAIILFYFFSELLRFRGIRTFPLAVVTQRAKRISEKEGIIYGPILLGLGILITLAFFDFPAYLPAILTVSVSDSLSAIIGKKYGKIHILKMKKRTLEGSVAFFVSSLIILLFTCSPTTALIAAVLGTLIELFAHYNLDNLLVPVGIALFLSAMRGS